MSVLDDIRIDADTKIEFYRYQTAAVLNIFEDHQRDDFKELEWRLLKAVGRQMQDNKCVFAVTKADGTHIYLWFYDHWVWVGSDIKVGPR